MKRSIVALMALAMLAVACTGGSSSTTPVVPSGGGVDKTPVTLIMQSNYSDPREISYYDKELAKFHEQYPWITVQHVGKGESQTPIIQAIGGGTPPDIALLFGPDNVASLCASGAFQDLNPYIKQDGIDVASMIPDAALRYTSYQGDQCALPSLTDAYGLYYNTDMFAAKGITEPPKTLDELAADAKKLTTFNPDGSIDVAGFIPWMGWYENQVIGWGLSVGAQWYDAQGKSAVASDPRWAQLMQWQKSLIDWYGVDKVKAYVAKYQNSEWNADHPFETGHLAMMMDGEWRTAFSADPSTGNPNLKFGTAPFPTSTENAAAYGSGQIGGDVLGVPRGVPHPYDSWLVVKYLSTNTDSLVYLSNKLGNVPTTTASLDSPDLVYPPQFKVFLDIFNNPQSAFKPLTTIGSGDQDLLTAFMQKHQAGSVSDLQGGLQQVATDIDNQTQLGSGP